MASGNFVAYYRVSTQRQGASGLGLGAQRQQVESYLNGGAWRLVAEYTEVESGKRNDRPQLAAAIGACKLHGATLVIAKLDRLARNVAFVSSLMEAGVEFVAVDFPQANRLTIHILAAVAEHEAAAISARTKAALAAAKARGRQLGGMRRNGRVPTSDERAAAIAVRVQNAAGRAAMILPAMEAIRAEGHTTLAAIAAELNRRGIAAPRGGAWSATQVHRVVNRSHSEAG